MNKIVNSEKLTLTTELIKAQFSPPLNQRENQLVDQIESLCGEINHLKDKNERLNWELTPKTYVKHVTKDMLFDALTKFYPNIKYTILGGDFGPVIKMNNETYNTKDYTFSTMERLAAHFYENSVILIYEINLPNTMSDIPKCEACAKYTYHVRVYVKADIKEIFPQCDEVSCIAKIVEKELGNIVANVPEVGENWGDPFDKNPYPQPTFEEFWGKNAY